MTISTTTGTFVRSPMGFMAFMPNPLPPDINWTTELVNLLSTATHLLGRLAGEGSKLPNPHILIRPFIAREAVLSSRIEGTQATLSEIFAAEAGVSTKRNTVDLQEVVNYVAALEYGTQRLQSLPLSLRLLCELHQKLMNGARGQHSLPGEFRRSQNWIGPIGCTIANARYVPPPPEKLMECLDAWEKFLHERTLPPLVQIALAHYQFEAIHPFLDGNGRLGRLLIILFLIEREILPVPLLYISAFFEATRPEYYDYLCQVSEKGAWDQWLHYFLTGIAKQAEDALERAERINEVIKVWHLHIAKFSSSLAVRLIERLASNPFLTLAKAAQDFNVAFTTMQRLVDKFEKVGIVTRVTSAKRNRVYCARVMLDILEAPARIGTQEKVENA